MTTTSQTVYLRGTAMYAKILGEPGLNYNKDGKEWTVDLIVDKDAVKELKSYGIANKVKQKAEKYDGQPFMTFKQKELRADGEKNTPIKVVDINGQPWNDEDLIGNGSIIDVKFRVKDWGAGKPKGVYPQAVRVLKHVEYAGKSEFPPVDGDEFPAAAKAPTFKEDFQVSDELNDEIPF